MTTGCEIGNGLGCCHHVDQTAVESNVAMYSPIIIAVRFVLARGTCGTMDRSTTRKLSTPRTRQVESITLPMLQVADTWAQPSTTLLIHASMEDRPLSSDSKVPSIPCTSLCMYGANDGCDRTSR